MKRRILVLDAFTNGYEAALKFIESQKWDMSDCEILFCGTHQSLLNQLVGDNAYAVVPIHNSTRDVGEVTEVTHPLQGLREKGYEITEIDRLDLPISHCLLAQQHIEDVTQINAVMSHPKAFAQCNVNLNRLGFNEAQRRKRPSTGNAAKAVAKFPPGSAYAAIASRAAAQEYGLKILHENIQDEPNNTTTFVLLEHRLEIESKVVGIVGISGAFGKLFTRFFSSIGCTVIGSDPLIPDGLSNIEVAQQADVLVFCVPIETTTSIIQSLLPHIRSEQLLMDVTSIKVPAIKTMMESTAQVVGLHPMFRPEVPFEGQTVVVCPERLTDLKWRQWILKVLSAMKATIKWSTAEEHDTYMCPVQVNPHVGTLVNAVLMAESGISITDSLSFTSPFYRIVFAQMGRLISQNPKLYTSIIMGNPATPEFLKHRIAIERKILGLVEKGDGPGLEALFMMARDHFGSEAIAEANNVFTKILGNLVTLQNPRCLMLECRMKDSQPGLLLRIISVFSARNINLEGIHSSPFGGKLQFTILLGEPRTSNSVRQAIEEIESWTDLTIQVI